MYAVRTIICALCGKVITKRMPAGRQYCSVTCSRSSPHLQRRTGKIVICQNCGKAIYKQLSLLRPKHHFCSLKCANQWQGRNKTEHSCKICNKAFRWSPSRSRQNKITYCSLACRDVDPERRDHLRRMNVKQLTMHPNNLERSVYTILDNIGIFYERQYLIGEKFCVDAFISSLGIVIQVDGDYWHGNPARFPILTDRQQKRTALDRSQNAYMQACGYRVIRFWESDVKRFPEQVTDLLRSALIQP